MSGARIRIADLERIPGVVDATLALEPEINALSERYRFMHHAVVVERETIELALLAAMLVLVGAFVMKK